MLIAIDSNGRRTGAYPGAIATCPICHEVLRPKCGLIVVHHFAHIAAEDCDTWTDGETDWHRNWKLTVPMEQREVVIGSHRADIVRRDGGVIELQHSSITAEEIIEREAFYGWRMVWVFDVRDAFIDGRLDLRPGVPRRRWDPALKRIVREEKKFPADYRTFRWKQAKKSIAVAENQVVLDLGHDQLLSLGRMFPNAPVGGYGFIMPRSEFVAWLNEPSPPGRGSPGKAPTTPQVSGAARL